MRPNKIREIRKSRRMTLVQLADVVGISHTYLTRLENQKRNLSVPMAERLASAMEVSVGDVLGIDTNSVRSQAAAATGFSEDAEEYMPAPGEMAPKFERGGTIDRWKIKSDALDKVGIRRGAVVYIDHSPEAIDNIRPLDCVIAQVYGVDLLEHKGTVLRQFIPPSLLITNTSGSAQPILDLEKDEVYIKGVIIGQYSLMGS